MLSQQHSALRSLVASLVLDSVNAAKKAGSEIDEELLKRNQPLLQDDERRAPDRPAWPWLQPETVERWFAVVNSVITCAAPKPYPYLIPCLGRRPKPTSSTPRLSRRRQRNC